jgi:hypothetical protein
MHACVGTARSSRARLDLDMRHARGAQIRALLEVGDVTDVACLLGRPYRLVAALDQALPAVQPAVQPGHAPPEGRGLEGRGLEGPGLEGMGLEGEGEGEGAGPAGGGPGRSEGLPSPAQSSPASSPSPSSRAPPGGGLTVAVPAAAFLNEPPGTGSYMAFVRVGSKGF